MSKFFISSEEFISTLIAFILPLFVLICYRFKEHDRTDVGFTHITCNAYLFTIHLGTISVSVHLLLP